MNALFLSAFTTLAALTALAAPASADAADACTPRVVQSETTFPLTSQLRHQTGTVYIAVSIDENGRASTAAIEESSGYRRLDRAATQSVINNWVFDVSGCERKDLPADHLVAVEYRSQPY
jgi:periplasmic protein TonB